MSLISTVYWSTLVTRISAARETVHISLPGIDEELAGLLVRLSRISSVHIHVCVDNSEDIIRNGLGETAGIDLLLANDISVKQCAGNRVSFIITDGAGFLYFPESRIFSMEPSGCNAIELDPLMVCRLLNHFFPAGTILEKEQREEALSCALDTYANSIDTVYEDIGTTEGSATQDFDTACYDDICASLENNPPLHPNLQRIINTYTARFQLIEFSFTGARLSEKKVLLPKIAIPINNEHLRQRIESTLRMFNELRFEDLSPEYKYLSDKVKYIRDAFLTPLTCRERKSVFAVAKKKELRDMLDDLKTRMPDVRKSIAGLIEAEKKKTKEVLREAYKKYFREYPPDVPQHKKDLPEEEFINEYVSGILVMIPFPQGNELAKQIELMDRIYDFTWEDFRDKSLLRELKQKGVFSGKDVNELIALSQSFAVRK